MSKIDAIMPKIDVIMQKSVATVHEIVAIMPKSVDILSSRFNDNSFLAIFIPHSGDAESSIAIIPWPCNKRHFRSSLILGTPLE